MNREDFRRLLDRRVLVFDGAMGTMLQALAYRRPWCPDQLNLDRPDVVEQVHRQYVAAGADIVQTNTFGATRIKLALYGLGDHTAAINERAVQIARRASDGAALVAGSIGPTGQLLAPYGPLDAGDCYESFLEQAEALVTAGVDLLNVETMSDTLEARLAVLAVREVAPELPLLCSMTFDRGLRTLTGATPEVVAIMLDALAVDVVGANCGGGPPEIAAAAAWLLAESCRPILVKPNAGLPAVDQDQESTVWTLTPEELGQWAAQMATRGVAIIGGCCGTTPRHIAAVAAAVKGRSPEPRPRPERQRLRLAGAAHAVYIDGEAPVRVIGERLNPTARPELQRALAEGDWELITAEAAEQGAAGADLIDVNTGHRLRDKTEAQLMRAAVTAVQKGFGGPVVIDSRDPRALEQGLLVCRGKPVLNSTTADSESLATVLGLARRYGAAVIGLPMAAGKVPTDVEARVALAARIVDAGLAAGLPRSDILIDGLVLAASVDADATHVTLETIRRARQELRVLTVLGVSNISYGLPARDHFNAAFLALAVAAGVDLVIVNPLAAVTPGVLKAADVLAGRDPSALGYIAWARGGEGAALPASLPTRTQAEQVLTVAQLAAAIRDGHGLPARGAVRELLRQGWQPIQLIDRAIVPGLEAIGAEYEARRAFLPQLLLAAEAAQAAFAVLADHEASQPEQVRHRLGTVVLATVKGDMHDIGKNVVAMLMRSHGFEVLDLGRDVDADAIVEAVASSGAGLVALSALMTTTMPEMGVVCGALRQAGLDVPVLIGGAVVTADFAGSIGASYAPDAVSGVRLARQLISE